jgi:Cu-Zn family superoxide dismutase
VRRNVFPFFALLLLLTATIAMAACDRVEDEQAGRVPADAPAQDAVTSDAIMASAETLDTAAVQLSSTQGNTANGSLTVTAASAGGGVRISGVIQGLRPHSEFGFHVHEKGDCSAPDATSAGEHFNPTSQAHGDPRGTAHHAGDIPNVRSDAQGVAEIDVDVPDLTLQSNPATDIAGKAIVLHAKPDDYHTQPSGNSGERIACGVISVQPS